MTQDTGDFSEPIPIIAANCPELIREALITALKTEPQLRYKGEMKLDLTSQEGYTASLTEFSSVMMDEGVLILILYIPEEIKRLPNIFAHLLEEYAGLRILVITGPLTASSITAYWMSLRWSKLPIENTNGLIGVLRDSIHFVASLDPSQDENQSSFYHKKVSSSPTI